MIRVLARAMSSLAISAFLGSVVVFLLLRMLKGDVATVILGQTATRESLEALRDEMGLDAPLVQQYWNWISGVFRGDMGTSYAAEFDIAHEIWTRVPLTFTLAISSLILSAIVSLVIGTFSAIHAKDWRGTWVDVLSQIGIAVPSFWLGLLMVTLFAVELGWLPAGGYVPLTEDLGEGLKSLTMPVLALSIPLSAVLVRYVRSGMLEVLDEDFIRTAQAKGLTLTRAAWRHGVRNASIPLVTVTILQLGSLLAGAVVIENVFTLPGLGRMLVVAVGGREALSVQSLTLVLMLMILTLNFLMDIAYGLLDPRIRSSGGSAPIT
ncbi:ABC transporter permease [Ilumatobacter sp.]|uniref:ABC transporter permease n=1 Tax=Ilumatobacter sp. TaxID=1967498 RepID=UPI003752D9E0